MYNDFWEKDSRTDKADDELKQLLPTGTQVFKDFALYPTTVGTTSNFYSTKFEILTTQKFFKHFIICKLLI